MSRVMYTPQPISQASISEGAFSMQLPHRPTAPQPSLTQGDMTFQQVLCAPFSQRNMGACGRCAEMHKKVDPRQYYDSLFNAEPVISATCCLRIRGRCARNAIRQEDKSVLRTGNAGADRRKVAKTMVDLRLLSRSVQR